MTIEWKNTMDENIESENDLWNESIYFKYSFDECQTIDDILKCLDNLKKQFKDMIGKF